MAIIIQQDTTEYSLFKSVNCSTCFGWYFTHQQELISLYLQYLVLMRPVLVPVVDVAGRDLPVQPRPRQVAVTISLIPDTADIELRAPDDGWRYHLKHVEQLTNLNKLCSVASCWIIIAII